MTKQSEVERAANMHYHKVAKEIWLEGKMATHKQSFLAGAKWVVEQAQQYADKRESLFMADGRQVISFLKKLLGGGE